MIVSPLSSVSNATSSASLLCHPPRQVPQQAAFCSSSGIMVTLCREGLRILHVATGTTLPAPTQGWVGLGTCIASCSDGFAVGSKCGKVILYDARSLVVVKVVLPVTADASVQPTTPVGVVSMKFICNGAVIAAVREDGSVTLTALPTDYDSVSANFHYTTVYIRPPVHASPFPSESAFVPLLSVVQGDPLLLGVVTEGGKLDIYRVSVSSTSTSELVVVGTRLSSDSAAVELSQPTAGDSRSIVTPKGVLVMSLSLHLAGCSPSDERVPATCPIPLVVTEVSIIRRGTWLVLSCLSAHKASHTSNAMLSSAVTSIPHADAFLNAPRMRQELLLYKRQDLGSKVCSYCFHSTVLAVSLPFCVCILDLIAAAAPLAQALMQDPASTALAPGDLSMQVCKKVFHLRDLSIGRCSLIGSSVHVVENVLYLFRGGKRSSVISIDL